MCHLPHVRSIALRRTTLYSWNDSLTPSEKDAVESLFERNLKDAGAQREATPICPTAPLPLTKRGAVNKTLSCLPPSRLNV